MPPGKGSLILEREGEPGTDCTSDIHTTFNAHLKACKFSAGFLSSFSRRKDPVNSEVHWHAMKPWYCQVQWQSGKIGAPSRTVPQKPAAHQFWLRLQMWLTAGFKESLSDCLGTGSYRTWFQFLSCGVF